MRKSVISLLLCAALCVCIPQIYVQADFEGQSGMPDNAETGSTEMESPVTGGAETENEEPGSGEIVIQSTKIDIPHKFYAYDTLELSELPNKLTFGAQPVSVLEQADEYTYLISTFAGPKWIKINAEYEKIVDPYRPYSYEQQIKDCFKLQNMYPELIDASEIGRSVEGRQIISVKMGKGDKSFVMVGSHHANEYISSTYIMKMIDEYAYAYHTSGVYGDYNIKELLDSVTFHLVIMLNPDGVNLVQNGAEAVLNKELISKINMRGKTYGSWKANLNGVDLNRNYPSQWNGKITAKAPSWMDFKGYAPASEPEILTMMSYSEKNEFLLAVSLHTKGEVLYWADSLTVNAFPGQKQLAQAISRVTGYKLNPVSSNPRIYAAGYENWFRERFLRPAVCVELTAQNGTNVPHNDADFDTVVWNSAKYLGAELAQQCLRAY